MTHPDTLALRPARLSDAALLAALSRDLIECGLPWRYTPRYVASLLADAEVAAVVACSEQRIEGFALMHFGAEHAHLALLCVRADQQRCGVGSRLFGWLLRSAQVAGIAEIGLELRADNAAALGFYRRLGFTPRATVDDYYASGIAACRMRLPLRRASGADPSSAG